jgi:5-methylcytosine-specific restriction protein A
VPKGYCPDHQQQITDRFNEQRNNDPVRRLYKNSRWEGTRIVVLGRDPLCRECNLALSTVVDHIINAHVLVKRFGERAFYDPDNLQGLCKPCHDAKTASEVGWAGGGRWSSKNHG